MLGNLINRHDAARLGRRLRRSHVTQMFSTAPAPGLDRVLAHRPAAGRLAGQVQWDEIPAIRRRWHTFGPREASFAELVAGRWPAGSGGRVRWMASRTGLRLSRTARAFGRSLRSVTPHMLLAMKYTHKPAATL